MDCQHGRVIEVGAFSQCRNVIHSRTLSNPLNFERRPTAFFSLRIDFNCFCLTSYYFTFTPIYLRCLPFGLLQVLPESKQILYDERLFRAY